MSTESLYGEAQRNRRACRQLNRLAARMITHPDARRRPFVLVRLPVQGENLDLLQVGHVGLMLEFDDVRIMNRFPHEAWAKFLELLG